MTSLRLRTAGPDDAEGIALLHADSWRRHYRGAYSDAFLDGDVVSDRLAVWSRRLADREARGATVVAEDGTDLVGFVHVVFDADDKWGSLIDNLHVRHARRRGGIGAALITRAAGAVTEGADGDAVYLWVLEQNTQAQGFYRAFGGVCVERLLVSPPGGVPDRLNGTPNKLRFAWADATLLTRFETR
ncbi:MAG: GNAT family N-acetyltransferase [Streptomyces sp.]|nr:GNAT family N-acetyltransferase [Streptomyces sp.]